MSLSVAVCLATAATLSPLGGGPPDPFISIITPTVAGELVQVQIDNTEYVPGLEAVLVGIGKLNPEVPVPPFGSLGINLGLAFQAVPATPDHIATFLIPNQVSLHTATLHMQGLGFVLDGASGQLKLSNTLSFVVDPPAPTNLTYDSLVTTYVQGNPINPNLPTWDGPEEENVSFSIDPALPAGLNIDSNTGAISGTATVMAATAVYTVTASNVTGADTVDLTITVDPAIPSSFDYSDNPAIYTAETTINDNLPILGGFADTYTVDMPLPDGLSLDARTGVISGTPTGLVANDTYRITASNITGSIFVDVDIEVRPAAPTNLTYTPALSLFADNLPITPLVPSVTAEVVDSYSIQGTLPPGLNFNTNTGVISGTPNAEADLDSYLITASNITGSDSTVIEIVIDTLPPPVLTADAETGPGETISYSVAAGPGTFLQSFVTPVLATETNEANLLSSPQYSPGLGITFLDTGSPTYSTENGDATFSWSIPVPNDTNLVGMRWFAQATAFQLEGFSGAVRISNLVDTLITLPPPTSVDYGVQDAVFLVGDPISPLTPTVVGFADDFTVSPPLPAGLLIDNTTGVISGTPTVALPEVQYTVTAANPSGGTTTDINIRVIDGFFPQFGFVANQDLPTGGSVSVFALDDETGQPRHHSMQLTGTVPVAVAATSDARFVYTANAADGPGGEDISVFEFDTETGVLEFVAATNVVGAIFVDGVVVDETDSYVYATATAGTDGVYGFSINGNGSLTPLAGSPYGTGSLPNDIAISGNVIITCSANGVDTIDSYSIDPGTGVLTAESTLSTGTSPRAVEFSPDGAFAYAANSVTNDVSAYIVGGSGTLTELGGSPYDISAQGGDGPEDLAISRKGFLYTGNLGNGTVSAFSIAPGGDLNPLAAAVVTGTATRGVTVDPSGSFLYAMNDVDNEIDVYDITVGGTLVPSFPVSTVRSQPLPAAMHISGGLFPLKHVSDRAYVASENNNQVNQFSINPDTGVLAFLAPPAATLGLPSGVVMDLAQEFAYVTLLGGTGVAAYQADGNGELTGVPPEATTNQAPWRTVGEPSGRFFYTFLRNNTGGVQKMDVQGTGLLTADTVTAAGPQTRVGCVHPTGRYLYAPNEGADTISQYLITLDGDLIPLLPANVATGSEPYAVCVDPTGRFAYVANSNDVALSMYTISATTGALTSLGSVPVSGTSPTTLAIEPSGRFLFLGYEASDEISIYNINPISGVVTEIAGSPVATDDEPGDLRVDASGQYLYVTQRGTSNTVKVYSINQSSGALTAGPSLNTGTGPRQVEVDHTFDLSSL